MRIVQEKRMPKNRIIGRKRKKEEVTSVKVLGFTFDSSFTWQRHIHEMWKTTSGSVASLPLIL